MHVDGQKYDGTAIYFLMIIYVIYFNTFFQVPALRNGTISSQTPRGLPLFSSIRGSTSVSLRSVRLLDSPSRRSSNNGTAHSSLPPPPAPPLSPPQSPTRAHVPPLLQQPQSPPRTTRTRLVADISLPLSPSPPPVELLQNELVAPLRSDDITTHTSPGSSRQRHLSDSSSMEDPSQAYI